MANKLASTDPETTPDWSDTEAVNTLLRKAQTGDRSTEQPLRELFASADRNPATLEAYGSPPKWLRDELAKQVAGDNVAVEEATRRTLIELRRDLEGPNPSAMEKLLAERASICWFLVNRYESYAANAKDTTIRQAEHQQRRIDRAHARFLSSLKTLATVRKLAIPALQVNIGANQINTLTKGC